MPQNPWRLALGGMVTIAAGVGVGRFVYTPILPAMAEALNLSVSQAGLIASANFLGYLAGALLAALKGFKRSPRSYLLVFLVVNALSLAGMGMTEDFVLHLLLRFVGGLAGAFILVFASALVLDRLALSGRSDLSALHFAGVGIGITISAVVVAVLLVNGGTWKDLWFASGLIGLAGLIIAALLIEPADPPAATTRPAVPIPNPLALRAMIIAYGLFGFGYIITATFIVAMVRGTPEISAMEPYVWTLIGLSAAPSVLLWMWVARRSGVIPAFAIACLVQAVGVASSILWISTAGLMIAVIFLGGTMMGITALGLVAARGLSKGDPRTNLALMTASFGVGQVIGPTFAGLVVDRLGSFAVPSLTASAGLVIAAGLAWFAETVKERNAPQKTAPGNMASL